MAEVYDALDGDRDDLDAYVEIADEFDAVSVLDVGCGTGALACRLAGLGRRVIGVDPADASIRLARAKPISERVRWMVGDASAFDGPPVDLVTMTGNVAQVFLSDADWAVNLMACRSSVRLGGWLAFEARNPDREAWTEWTPESTLKQVQVPGGGHVKAWCAVTKIEPPVISFRWTYVFDRDGAVLVSDSSLRFRSRDEIVSTLKACGFAIHDVRDAPDRPGAEMVFLAQSV